MLKLVTSDSVAGTLKKEDIKAMVGHWRNVSLRKRLKYAHFKLLDVLQLLIDNEVLPTSVVTALKDPANQAKLQSHGLKIYIGRHKELKTCPPANDCNPNDYLHKATTILCTTYIKEEDKNGKTIKGFRDMLANNKVIIGARSGKGQDGLDQAEIEPPFHADECEIYDIGEDNICDVDGNP